MPPPRALGATMSPNGLGAAAMAVLQPLPALHSLLCKSSPRVRDAPPSRVPPQANISARSSAAGKKKKKRGEMMEKPIASLNKCNSTTGLRHNDPVLAGCIFSSFFFAVICQVKQSIDDTQQVPKRQINKNSLVTNFSFSHQRKQGEVSLLETKFHPGYVGLQVFKDPL